MKKRLLALTLTLSLFAGLLPTAVYGAHYITLPPGSNYNMDAMTPSKSSYFSTAHVQNLGTTTGTNGTARKLQIVVTPKGSPTAGDIYAVVMRRSDYETIMENGPADAGLSGADYFNKDGDLTSKVNAAAIGYYGIARKKTVENSTASFSMDVVVANGTNDGILGGGGATTNIQKTFTLSTADRTESTYVDEYVLIAFGGDRTGDLGLQPGDDKDANYYIDYFYMDANGYVLTPSYGVRYNTNDPYSHEPAGTKAKDAYASTFSGTLPNGTILQENKSGNTPLNNSNRKATATWIQRAKWGENDIAPYTLLPASNSPTRSGYTFVGWSTEAIRPLKAGEEAGTVLPAGAKLYAAGETYPKSGDPAPELYKIHDLYAVWRVVPVQFGDTVNTVKASGKENDHWVINYPDNNTIKGPQFGVAFTTNAVNLAAPGSAGSQPNGRKVYATVTYKDGVLDAKPNTYGLTVGAYNNSTSQWSISGTPNANSEDKPVTFEITVTDESNGTQDTIIVKFTKVKKGAQPVPTLDSNTGLESRVEPVTDSETTTVTQDGQIFGFYSKGPVIGTDTGYLGAVGNTGSNTNVTGANGTVGTGTMTDYYIAKRMIYQYRPSRLVTENESGELTEIEIPWTAFEDESDKDHAAAVETMKALGFDKMPNHGWREVPMPKNWYTSPALNPIRDTFNKSLELNATSIVTTEYDTSQGGYAPVAAVTDLPEGFAGWLDSYGYIAYSDTTNYAVPVVHGLHEDDEYEIRFRANTNNEASASQYIKIGGAVVSANSPEPTSGAGLAVNLAGGTVAEENQEAYQSFVDAAAAMELGDVLKIPDITPERENYVFRGWILNGDTSVLYKYVDPNAGGSESGGEEPPENEAEEPGGESTTEPGGSEPEEPGEGDEGGTGDTSDDQTKDTVTLEKSPSSLAAYWEATSGGFVTVVCYDWDNTLLGSVTVPKGADASVVEEYMNEFVKNLQSPESKEVDDTKASFFVDDEKYPMTYKRGYSFNCWLPNDSDLPTHCGRAVNGDNKLITIKNPLEEGTAQTFNNLAANITVKACYKDNDELYYVAAAAQMTYTMKVQEYSRIGTTANYIMTYRCLRQKTITGDDGSEKIVGVPRLVEPQLRLIYNGNMYNFFTLGTSDDVSFTIYPNGNAITGMTANMVDFYEASVLTNASTKANLLTDTSGTSATDPKGFRHRGTITMINGELATGSTKYLTVVALRTQAGLTFTDLTVAQTNLRAAWLRLNTVDGIPDPSAERKPVSDQRGLTFDEMNYAIANDGKLQP